MKHQTERIELMLDYTGGRDEPDRGVFRNQVVDPKYMDEITIAVRSDPNETRPWPGNDKMRPQVHIAGSARALEELGRYLVALARLQTADVEPYGSFDNVRNADGGSVRLLPRRVPPTKER